MEFKKLFKLAKLNEKELFCFSEDQKFANELGYTNAIEYYTEGETQNCIITYAKPQFRENTLSGLKKFLIPF